MATIAKESEDQLRALLATIAKEIHRPRRLRFPTRGVESRYPNQIWAIDIADMTGSDADEAAASGGYRYLLVVVDVYSRFAAGAALKHKTAAETLDGFKGVCEDLDTHPELVWADQGKEFVNKQMGKFLEQIGAKLYHTYGQHKVAIAERFIRTIKGRIRLLQSERNTSDWVAQSAESFKAYNDKVHTTTKEKPRDRWVSAVTNLRSKASVKHRSGASRFKLGDRVRVSRLKGAFEKESDTNWTREVYTIARVKNTTPTTYVLSDHKGEVLQGTFYDQELQKTNTPEDLYLVEKVLKTRKRGGHTEQFVKWLGYPDSANSWISA